MANEHDITFCATDWAASRTADLPNTIGILGDLSRFPETADRIQQGFLNFLYLGRLMRHPQGLASNAAFQVSGRSAFDTSALYYDGNSQGGILGGALAAMAPDHQPRGAGRAGDELLAPAHAQLQLEDLRGDLQSRVPRPGDPSARASR